MQLAQDTPSSEEVLRGRAQELQEEMAAVKAQYKEEIAQHVMSILQQKNLSHAIAIENEYLNHKISELQAQAAATQSGLVPRDNLTELEGKLIKAQEEIDELSRMRDMENLRWEQQLLARDLTVSVLIIMPMRGNQCPNHARTHADPIPASIDILRAVSGPSACSPSCCCCGW